MVVRKLAPDERYLSCECGYRFDAKQGRVHYGLNEVEDCPQCKGRAIRIDYEDYEYDLATLEHDA